MLRILYDDQLIEKEDFDAIQDYSKADIQFILDELFAYEYCFTGTNFEVVQHTPASMVVVITAGEAIINYHLTELLANYEVTIDPPDVAQRIDIITATEVMTDDAGEVTTFIDPGTGVIHTHTVARDKAYRPTITYRKGTIVVPPGDTLLATITVDPAVTEIYTADIADGRTPPPSTNLPAHIAATPIDHPAGSIGNVAIAANADIALTKIDGKSVDTLDRLIGMGFPANFHEVITFDGDGKPTAVTHTGDHSFGVAIAYNADDTVDTVTVTDALYELLIELTWVGGLPTEVDGAVNLL